MKKIITAKEGAGLIKSGMSIMAGGFLKTGVAKLIYDEMVKCDIKDLTLITNDTSYADSDRGQLVANRMVKKVIASHIGTNSESGKMMNAGEMEVILTPQGTLAEIIRGGGAGLGGILTPTGLGTIVEKGKDIIEIDGKKYILEKTIKADVAILYASKADNFGNLGYIGSTRNFNTVMATAAETVIVEADEIVDVLDPQEIIVPGIFVDYIIQGAK